MIKYKQLKPVSELWRKFLSIVSAEKLAALRSLTSRVSVAC